MTNPKRLCPGCGHKFDRTELARSYGGTFGMVRKVMNCPACGVALTWSKWPWRIMLGGGTAVLCMAIRGLLISMNEDLIKEWPSNLEFWIFLPICLATAVACLMTRLVPVEPAKRRATPNGAGGQLR